jgi:flagellar hook assembly protein FlgD
VVSTTIGFSLQAARHARLQIVDVLGRRVRELIAGELVAGRHVVSWDGRNDLGNRVSSGVYFYILSSGGTRQAKKMIVLK